MAQTNTQDWDLCFADVLEATGKSYSWCLQEIQNTFSFGEDIPIRLVNRKTVNIIAGEDGDCELAQQYRSLIELGGMEDPGLGMKLCAKNDFDPLIDYLTENLWITDGSYSNPVITLVRPSGPAILR